jgi:hypothetical protein
VSRFVLGVILCAFALAACSAILGDYSQAVVATEGGAPEGGSNDVAIPDAHDAATMDAASDTMAIPDVAVPDVVGPVDAGMDVQTVQGDGSFQPVTDIPLYPDGGLGGAPSGLITADINNDHIPDLASCTSTDVVVLFGTGTGAFQSPVVVPAPNCVGIAAFDLNNDGDLELAVIQSSPTNQLTIFMNQGGENFYTSPSAPQLVFPTAENPIFVAADDFNQDHYTDIVVAWAGSFFLFENTDITNSTLTPVASVSTNEPPGDVVFKDLNGDGIPDAIVGTVVDQGYVDRGTPDASPYFGSGEAMRAYGGTTVEPEGVTSGDIDGDGIPDVVFANLSTGVNSVSIFYGGGMFNFTTAFNVTIGPTPYDVANGDFNGDGKADLVASLDGTSSVGLLFSTSTRGTFLGPTTLALSDSSTSIVVADFNGDHKFDIAVHYTTLPKVGILFGN